MTIKLSVEACVDIDLPLMHVAAMQTIVRDDSSYGTVPVVMERHLSVTFKETGETIQECSLPDLPRLLKDHSAGDLSSHIRNNVNQWSDLICFMYDLGLVVRSSFRFGPLQEAGYELEKMLARTERNDLVFYFVEFGLHEHDYTPKQIRWNMDTQQYTICKQEIPIR